MENFGTIMDVYLKQMEERITERVTQELENNSNKVMKQIWMNKKELAEYLGVCFKTLSKFMKENPNFPSTNISGAIRFNANQVDEWFVIYDEVIKVRSKKFVS